MSRRVLIDVEDILSTCYGYALSTINHKLNVSRHGMDIFSCFRMWNSHPEFVHIFHLPVCVLSFLCNVEHFSTRNEFILFDVLSFVIPFKGWDLFNCKVLY